MKYLLFFLSFIFVQCSPSTYNATSESDIDNKQIYEGNFAGTVEEKLAQMLRKESGVMVNQTNGTYQVKIRGLANSFGTSTSPLFVVDGTSIGHDFKNAAESIAGNRIKSIRVLKGKDAAIYGTRGSAGVIEIKTKTPSFTQK